MASRASARLVAIKCARILDENVGEDVQVLDVQGLSPVSDYIVIVTASSPPHAKALADAAESAIEKNGGRLHHLEGDQESPWILVDAIDVIVHIFRDPTRKFYDLERLWADAKKVTWKTARKPPPRKKSPKRK